MLEEGGHWWWVLKAYSLIPFPVFPLCFLCIDKMRTFCFWLLLPGLPHHYGLYPSEEVISENTLKKSKGCLFVRDFYHSNRKVTSTKRN